MVCSDVVKQNPTDDKLDKAKDPIMKFHSFFPLKNPISDRTIEIIFLSQTILTIWPLHNNSTGPNSTIKIQNIFNLREREKLRLYFKSGRPN